MHHENEHLRQLAIDIEKEKRISLQRIEELEEQLSSVREEFNKWAHLNENGKAWDASDHGDSFNSFVDEVTALIQARQNAAKEKIAWQRATDDAKRRVCMCVCVCCVCVHVCVCLND